jgi:hypothetical protein
MKFYEAVRKLLVGHIQTDRETGDLISLLSFFGSRLTTEETPGRMRPEQASNGLFP